MSSYRASGPSHISVPAILLLSLLAGCQRQPHPQPAAETAAPAQSAQASSTDTPVPDADLAPLRDVIENTPSYVVGISYPPGMENQPGLSSLIRNYADKARAELKQAIDALGGERPTAPYELSLSFVELVQTPQLLVIAADGSSYTGGAHGSPLVARFVWLVQAQKRLTAAELIPSTQGWQTVANYVRTQLHKAAETRAQADQLSTQESASLFGSVERAITAGTAARAENFAEFQPLLDGDGKITALRFVFAPYQVGPYSDGTQSVDVPASLLLPFLAEEYAPLFVH